MGAYASNGKTRIHYYLSCCISLALVALILIGYQSNPDNAPAKGIKNFYNLDTIHDGKFFTSNGEKKRIFQLVESNITGQMGILFLKTHKTGSSTVSSILWRQLCIELRRNCFLPPSSNPGRTWDFARSDHKQYVQSAVGTQGKKMPFDVWLSHAKYHEYLTEIIPTPRIFFSIVRRPAYRFQSAWYWYKLDQSSQLSLIEYIDKAKTDSKLFTLDSSEHSKKDNFVIELDMQWKFRTGLDSTSQELIGMSRYSRNFLALHRNLIDDITHLKLFLVVNERFEESLLVLRWLLHWESNESLFFLPRKVQSYHRITNETLLHVLDDLQPFDSLLYRAANHALDEYLDIMRTQVGSNKNFTKEIETLRIQLHSLPRICNETESLALRVSLLQSVIHNVPEMNSPTKTEKKGVEELCSLLALDNDGFVQSYWKQKDEKSSR